MICRRPIICFNIIISALVCIHKSTALQAAEQCTANSCKDHNRQIESLKSKTVSHSSFPIRLARPDYFSVVIWINLFISIEIGYPDLSYNRTHTIYSKTKRCSCCSVLFGILPHPYSLIVVMNTDWRTNEPVIGDILGNVVCQLSNLTPVKENIQVCCPTKTSSSFRWE